jgi:hypothetical protein
MPVWCLVGRRLCEGVNQFHETRPGLPAQNERQPEDMPRQVKLGVYSTDPVMNATAESTVPQHRAKAVEASGSHVCETGCDPMCRVCMAEEPKIGTQLDFGHHAA